MKIFKLVVQSCRRYNESCLKQSFYWSTQHHYMTLCCWNLPSESKKRTHSYKYAVPQLSRNSSELSHFIKHFNIKLCFFSSDTKQCNNKKEEEWENLLDNNEKKSNISSIPVKKENIYTIPNLLSTFRIVLTPYIGYLILCSNFTPALCLAWLAAFTDLIDGRIARAWPSQRSALGSALDPLADKILVSVLAVSLSCVNIMPPALTVLFIVRDLLLIGSVFYLRYKTCPPPVTFKRYFDPTLVNVKLSPTSISKMNTVFQLCTIWFSLASPVFGFVDSFFLKSLWTVTAFTTVASGVSYITQKDTVRMLKENQSSNKS